LNGPVPQWAKPEPIFLTYTPGPEGDFLADYFFGFHIEQGDFFQVELDRDLFAEME